MNWFLIVLIFLGAVMLINVIGLIIYEIVDLSKPPHQETNGDKLRNYSDEELADFLAKLAVYRRDKQVRQSEYKKEFFNWLRRKA